MEVADPVSPKCDCAITATSASGSCSAGCASASLHFEAAAKKATRKGRPVISGDPTQLSWKAPLHLKWADALLLSDQACHAAVHLR